MLKTYKLYKLNAVFNDVPMIEFISSCTARNIVEAEFMFQSKMITGIEYLIFIQS